MLTVLYNGNSPPDRVALQIMTMVADNLTDLSMLGVPPSNLLHSVYCWALQYEIGLYLKGIGKAPSAPVELIVAYENDNDTDVAGFLLYLPIPSHPDACGVTYMAVKQSSRRRGIGSAMMREAMSRYPHVELTCFVKKVPFYESLGFKVLDTRNTQVVLNTRSASTTGMMGIIDTSQILNLPVVKQIHASLVQRWGIKEMAKAEKQLLRHKEQLERQASTFLTQRHASA